jgi:hypothetical protein
MRQDPQGGRRVGSAPSPRVAPADFRAWPPSARVRAVDFAALPQMPAVDLGAQPRSPSRRPRSPSNPSRRPRSPSNPSRRPRRVTREADPLNSRARPSTPSRGPRRRDSRTPVARHVALPRYQRRLSMIGSPRPPNLMLAGANRRPPSILGHDGEQIGPATRRHRRRPIRVAVQPRSAMSPPSDTLGTCANADGASRPTEFRHDRLNSCQRFVLRGKTGGSGEIGSRAGFRCPCPKGRGGSSPPFRTRLGQECVRGTRGPGQPRLLARDFVAPSGGFATRTPTAGS